MVAESVEPLFFLAVLPCEHIVNLVYFGRPPTPIGILSSKARTPAFVEVNPDVGWSVTQCGRQKYKPVGPPFCNDVACSFVLVYKHTLLPKLLVTYIINAGTIPKISAC